MPQFQKFDDKQGNTQEHVVHFLDSTGAHANDHGLRLRELSKSLTDHAYTWYVNLKSGYAHD